MRIVVVGAGAIGSLFGASLAESHDVTLVGRPAHVRAVGKKGLKVTELDGSVSRVGVDAVTDPTVLRDRVGEDATVDLVLVLVKAYDTADAIRSALPVVGEGTRVLTLQNGLGNADTIADHVPREAVLAGTTSHGVIFEGPGRIRHAGTGPTSLGRYAGPTDERTRLVAAAFSRAGLETSVVEDVRTALWEKLLVNVGVNAATALARVPNGAIAGTDPGQVLLAAAIEEALDVAAAAGVEVGDEAVERATAVAEATATNESSMLQDVRAGSRTEVGAMNGAVVDLADEHGVPAPVNRTLTDLVRLAERREGWTDADGQRGRDDT